MSISSWMMRNRSLRPRARRPPEDYYRLDPNKKMSENAFDIMSELSCKTTTETRHLSLLNGIVKVLEQTKGFGCGFTTEEFLYCISASLTHQFTQVRAGALRAIRYLLKSAKDLQIFNALQLTYFLCRSFDVLLDNEEERVQALKLIRKMLAIGPDLISPALVRSLIALGDSGVEDNDRMLRACLATLCELCVLNSTLFIVCGGVTAITRNVQECHSPRIAESLCGVLLHLLEWPQTRNIAGVRLDCLAAPYCDFTYRLGIMDKNKDARDLRFTCSRLALLSVLRSWTGTIEFCNPNKPSGLKAIVDVLYLNQVEVRKAILDLLYELLWLPQPIWTDEYSVALAIVDPADYRDEWRLTDGFVAMEGRNVLPSLANRVPNISEIHTALLLYCFLETGLLNALVEVVISADTFLSVRATVLIGKLLQLMHTHLPADICKTSSALPTLVAHATQGNYQAMAAISALQSLHQMLKNRPAACSMFLDLIIQSGNIMNSKLFKRDIRIAETTVPATYSTNNIMQQQQPPPPLPPPLPPLPTSGGGGGGVGGTLERRRLDSFESSTSTSGDERSGLSTLRRGSFKRSRLKQFFENMKHGEKLIRDSMVLQNDDGKVWDWDIIISILRSDAIGKLEDIPCRFIRRLVHFYKPSSNRFSHQDLIHVRHIPSFVIAGIDLIDWLVKSSELECIRLLTDLFSDINGQLLAISSSRSAHDCLFSPQHMSSTMCQQYFLYIGRMCRTQKGLSVLNNTNVFKQLLHLVTTTLHVCYIKLIVSGLDYSINPHPRKILDAALTTGKCIEGRRYATQFMRVLLRAKIPDFEVWGLPLLIKQTKDADRMIMLTALEILDEACHEKIYLEEIVSLWPKFDALGDQGKLLMARFYSIPRGVNHTNARADMEIKRWVDVFNKKYVQLLEADTHSVLTLHTKNEDGTYCRRSCSSRPTVIPPNILPHLYGQLVQTNQGMDILLKFSDLPQQIETLLQVKCNTEFECVRLKAAIWAIAHVSTSKPGLKYLLAPTKRVFERIIDIVKYCEVYSVRATALHALGLIGSTKEGANLLMKFDWACVRHDRDTAWPVCDPEEWITPIRHQIDEMPPYNYTGIDEDINGYFQATDTSSSRLMDESYDASSDIESQIGSTGRSRTMPESVAKSEFAKHTRSLSESKTTDGLSLAAAAAANLYISRTRFNSSTDSNTSGVSSCESMYGRYLIGDLHQTLSPIPSSSNLLEVKKTTNDRFRRTSLTGAPITENSLTRQDIEGYKKLRSIRRHQRPMLSESAADELAGNDITIRSQRKLLGQEQRQLKVRSLDRQSYLTVGVDEIQMRSLSFSSTRVLKTEDPKGPCYSGICLPKNINDIFNTTTVTGTYVSRCVQEMDAMDLSLSKHQNFMSDSLNEGDESTVSSLSDISTNSKRSKWVGKHNRANCLQCCRLKTNRFNARTDSDINMHRRKSNQSSSIQFSDISFDSPESVFSEESMIDRITANVLRQVQRMANPVWIKQTKISLLELKQKHPTTFQDICLYSEVCKALCKNTYRLIARRFLQELFLDLDFDQFYVEPMEIIGRKERERELIQATASVVAAAAAASSSLCDNNSSRDRLIVDDKDMISNSISSISSSSLSVSIGGHDCVDSSGGDGPSTSSTLATPASSSSASSQAIPSAAYYPNLLKSHMKSPPLASVYESSIENLSESFGKNKSQISSSSGSGGGGGGTKIITIASINPIPSSLLSNNNKNEDMPTYNRQRFNTLELDLSCTKNKFPIKHRESSKEYVSPTTPITSSSLTNNFDSEYKRSLSLTSSAGVPKTGSLYCEKRLESSATLSSSSSSFSEATLLLKRNKSVSSSKTETKQ